MSSIGRFRLVAAVAGMWFLNLIGALTALAGRLPAGYMELEYIESTGTQWIDTKIVPRQSLEIAMRFRITAAEQQNASVFGAQWPTYLLVQQNGKLIFYMAGRVGADFGAIAVGTLYDYALDGDGTMTLVGEGADPVVKSNVSRAYADNYTLSFFNETKTQTHSSKMRLYSAVLAEGGTTLRNFVPAKEVASGFIGLYDIAGGYASSADAFYANVATSGPDFTPGPAVSALSVEDIPPQPFNGTDACEPHPVVRLKADGSLLTEGEDYDLSWSNNDAGTGVGQVTITGKGSACAGEVLTLDFAIVSPSGSAHAYFASPSGAATGSCRTSANAGTIKAAMDLALAAIALGETAEVGLLPGTYDFFEAADASGSSYITTSSAKLNLLTLSSTSGRASDTIVRGGGSGTAMRFFEATSTAGAGPFTVKGISFVRMRTDEAKGGACFYSESPNIRFADCVFSGNSAPKSACVHLTHRIVSDAWDRADALVRCTFTGNSTDGEYVCNVGYGDMGISDCVFSNNAAKCICAQHKGTMTGCVFFGNVGHGASGAFCASGAFGKCRFEANWPTNAGSVATGSFTDCDFVSNTNGSIGVSVNSFGIANFSSAAVVSNCVFEGNVGGLAALFNASANTIANRGVFFGCTFRNNLTGSILGACVAHDCQFVSNGYDRVTQVPVLKDLPVVRGNSRSNTVLHRCAFVGNYAGNYVCGKWLQAWSCLFADNVSGAGASPFFEDVALYNCTVAGCRGGANQCVLGINGTATANYCGPVVNSLFYDNLRTDGGNLIEFGNCRITTPLDNIPATNCVFTTGTLAEGNDTCFRLGDIGPNAVRFAAADELHPWGWYQRRTSFVVDRGRPLDYEAAGSALDLTAVVPRTVGGAPDIGCYEYQSKRSGLIVSVK